jgi:Fe-S-cluster containining protein
MFATEQVIPAGYCARCRGCCRFSQQQGPWAPHLLAAEEKDCGRIRVVARAAGSETPFCCSALDDEKNNCAIYDRRPFECRLYPFVLNKKEGRFFLAVDPNCPFVKEQEHGEEFIAYAVRLAAHLQEPGWRGILRENIHLFQTYPGVKDITELTI